MIYSIFYPCSSVGVLANVRISAILALCPWVRCVYDAGVDSGPRDRCNPRTEEAEGPCHDGPQVHSMPYAFWQIWLITDLAVWVIDDYRRKIQQTTNPADYKSSRLQFQQKRLLYIYPRQFVYYVIPMLGQIRNLK